ncbi:MAG: SO_0444 family Cu/Zn efflux transporter [Akkermansia sp.]
MYQYFINLQELFIDMSFYMVIGLLFTGFLHAFIKEAWIKNQLGGKSVSSSVKAAVVGVPLPLCSCGVVPMAVYLREQGASKGAVMSFLTSTPQTGIDSLIASYGMLGPVFAIYRALAAFVSGIITGLLTELFDKEVKQKASCCCCHSKKEEPVAKTSCCCHSHEAKKTPSQMGIAERCVEMFRFAFVEFLDKITVNFILGLLIAALIATLIPADLFEMISNPWCAMLLALAIGIPMYVCSTASIPIALSLMMKGFSPGAAFVFLFAGPATNVASLAVLLKVFSKKSIAIYLASISGCALIFGYVLDLLFGDVVKAELAQLQCGEDSVLKVGVSSIFALLLMLSLYRRYVRK